MTTLGQGVQAPDFTLAAIGADTDSVTLSELLTNGPVVLYFYPKDMTPGCTTESCDFRDNFARFKGEGVTVVGISKDSIDSHRKFADKHELPFILASDPEGEVIEAYGCWKEKSMYGKTFMGIERSTFLIHPDGTIKNLWRKVKVKGHVDEVLAAIGD